MFKKAESQAIDAGRDARDKLLLILRRINKIISLGLIVCSLVATIISWGDLKQEVVWGILFIVNCFSFYDVWKAREQRLDALWVWIANQHETKVVEEKKAEYQKLFENNKKKNNEILQI